ncbi:heptaprenyl diphosphate synthase component 1 [Planococcus lenghuensis]|uniref:Heptaprenyl diphosphate synthase n=1 Tax=Planococcus lenghuensis TaxID=2213202 RepID=A0A1Q2KZL8_9BACL|nr:heptaprenyl diphosphate synthase component 1 [Planococcus lenghuensis]AQQ53631.1 hypothetical protein B0X71_11460 [Planococcus lenghuensis]
MNEQQIDEKITLEQVRIMELVHHRTLEKFTAGPAVKRTRLFFLLLPYLNGEYWSSETEASSKTVSIVQAALDAHEHVEENGAANLEQQLTVLAGDYYSGVYYQVLARLKNIDLVRQLSSAIAEISENKASLYESLPWRPTDIEIAVGEIEAGLIRTFYEFYSYGSYERLAIRALSLLRYESELELLKSGGRSPLLNVLAKATGSMLTAEQWLHEKVNTLYSEVVHLAKQQPLQKELESFLLNRVLPHRKMEQLIREG